MARIKRKIRPLYIIAVIGALLQGLMLSDLPLLSLVVMSTLLCAVLIFFTWRVKKDFPLSAKIISTGSLLFFTYFFILLSSKMWILFCVIWFAVLFVTVQILKNIVYRKKMDTDIFTAQFLYLVFWLTAAANNYTYSNASVPFWKISLPLALVIGVFQALKTEPKEKNKKKDLTIKFCIFLACGVLTFFIVSIGMQNLNYALDVSEPTRYSAVIEAKDSFHGRRRSYRRFRFTVNGETIDMDVSPSIYRAYNKGDTYNITSYKGAFGVPYYMAGRN